MGKKYKYRKTFTVDGKRYECVADTLDSLYTKIAEKKMAIATGKVLISNSMTVEAWGRKCVDQYKTNQAANTASVYRYRINHCVYEYIGDRQLKSITPIECQEVLNRQIGNSAFQINIVYQMLNFIFQKAVENHLIPYNPAKNITKPAGTKKSNRSLTNTEALAFQKIAYCKKYLIFALMHDCGCRPGEARNLQGRDISIKDGRPILHIRGTKSANADRFVPIPHRLFEIIKDTPKFDYIACPARGSKFTETSYGSKWEYFKIDWAVALGGKREPVEYVDRYGEIRSHLVLTINPLDPTLRPYSLRHTFCTNLCKAGIDIRVAQKLMGHANIDLTSRIYTHVDLDLILQAADKMAAYK